MARDFGSAESTEIAGILCVFPNFGTARMEQKTRHPAADELFRGSLVFSKAGDQWSPLRLLFQRGGKSKNNNPSVTASPRHLPLHKGGYPLRRGRADEYPRGAGRICNAPSSRTAALGIGPYTVRWKLAGTGGQGRPPLQVLTHGLKCCTVAGAELHSAQSKIRERAGQSPAPV